MAAVSATGNIRLYQLVIGGFSLLILPISYLFLTKGYLPKSTFMVSISFAVLAFIFRLIFIKKQIPEFSISQFIQEVLVRNIPVVIFSLMAPLMLLSNMHPGLMRLSLVVLTSFSISTITFYYIGLKNNEKLFVKNALMSVGKNIYKRIAYYRNK
mgnify:FL=1